MDVDETVLVKRVSVHPNQHLLVVEMEVADLLVGDRHPIYGMSLSRLDDRRPKGRLANELVQPALVPNHG